MNWLRSIISVAILLMYSSAFYGQGTSAPNLTPYQPSGWSDKIVVSTQTGTHTDSSSLRPTDTLYLDWAVANVGNASVAANSFQVTLYVDGQQKQTGPVSLPLDANTYVYKQDYLLGFLSAGTHTIRLVADSTNTIVESNEADNEYSKIVTVSAPLNLTPFQPIGWSDKIVVSTVTGTSTDSGSFKTTDTLYVDWAVINNGSGSITASFQIKLFVDGQERYFWNVSSPLDPDIYYYVQDQSVGSLGAGVHTIRIVADTSNAIAETNEGDNDYTKTITVVQAAQCFSLLTTVAPAGSGTINKSQLPNCGGGTSSLESSPSVTEPFLLTAHSLTNLPPVPKRGLATLQNFALLKEKVLSHGRVSVIVGLRTEFKPEGMLTDIGAVQDQRNSILQAQEALLAGMFKYNVTSISKFKFIPYMAFEVDTDGLQFLEASTDIISIRENETRAPLLAESVPLIGAPAAWSSGFSGAGQTIAILDVGADKTHPFLAGKVVSEACYSTPSLPLGISSFCPSGVANSTDPGSGVPCSLTGCEHGTHVAGIAAGKGASFSGVAKDANIIAIQVFSQVGNLLRSQDRDVIHGLERVYELASNGSFRIAAVNLSLGSGRYTSPCDSIDSGAYKAAIDNLRLINIPTVIASGNDGYSDALSAPACISTAISVGSTNDGSLGTTKDSVSRFFIGGSNSAYFLNLLAPGQYICSSVPNFTSNLPICSSGPSGLFAIDVGTSMAAPHVAGAWAVLKSKVPNATVSQVLSALTTTGVPITDIRNNIIKPRIQVDAALNALTVGQAAYSGGTNVTLTAVPNAGYQFKSWSGCDSVSGNLCTVTMTKSPSVTANFEPVSTAGSDLVLNSLSGSSTVPVGGQISLAAEVKNQGSGNSGPFRLGFYLSADANITTSDTLIAICDNSSGMGAGYSWKCSGPVALPATLPPATYNLGAIVDDQGKVAESNETNNTRVGSTVSITSAVTATLFVPIVLSSSGLNNSFFTSEMSLTNRGSQDATLHFAYSASFGSGSGEGTDYLPAGQQRIGPDAITYLRSIGVPIPSTGNRGGTLLVGFTGISSLADAGVIVRTTTAAGLGRAGLAYPGVLATGALTGPSYLCGLRQNGTDRSNVAIQNVGGSSDGNITLRLTVFSGDNANPVSKILPDEALPPGGFKQITGILGSNGLSLTNGYVRIERINGSAPYFAYAVINDQFNSDGSFVPPILESSLVGKTRITLPVIVEANTFTSELVVTNWSSVKKTLNFGYVADAITATNSTAGFHIDLNPSEQLIYPDFVQVLRDSKISGVGPKGPAFVGALFGGVSTGDLSGISIAARTSSPGDGGRYGLFYTGLPNGTASTTSAWVYGLQQNAENRSNLALINTGEVDASANVFRIELFDGNTGIKVNTVEGYTVNAKGWKQIGTILAQYAPGTTQGYARVTRTSGNNPFIAYAVINDGGQPGQRTGDGAFIPSSP